MTTQAQLDNAVDNAYKAALRAWHSQPKTAQSAELRKARNQYHVTTYAISKDALNFNSARGCRLSGARFDEIIAMLRESRAKLAAILEADPSLRIASDPAIMEGA